MKANMMNMSTDDMAKLVEKADGQQFAKKMQNVQGNMDIAQDMQNANMDMSKIDHAKAKEMTERMLKNPEELKMMHR